MRVHKKHTNLLFSFFLSCFMSLIVSGISTARTIGLGADFPLTWLFNWLPSWGIAFPAVLVVAPFVRRLVARMVDTDA